MRHFLRRRGGGRLWSTLWSIWLRAILLGAVLLGGGLAQAQVAVPPLKSAVTDLTGTLSSSQSQQLEARLKAFSAARGSQVAVLLIPTTKPEAIEQFSIRVAEAWKIGRGGKDDGVILVVAKDPLAFIAALGLVYFPNKPLCTSHLLAECIEVGHIC